MKKNILTLLSFFYLTTCFAVSFTYDNATNNVLPNATFPLKIRVAGFTNIVAFQMTLNYDPAVVRVNSITPALTGFSVASNIVTSGTIRLVAYTASGVNIADATDIITLSLTAIGPASSTTTFTSSTTSTLPLLVYDNSLAENASTFGTSQVNIIAPLPVEMTTFTAKTVEKTNVLNWATASETNNKGYDIERSRDGNTFQSIGNVKGIGKAANYNFVDVNPYNGVNYYRLKQMDFDDKETLSKVISIQIKGNDRKLKAYPNPVSNVLAIETEATGDYQIINILGQIILRGPVSLQQIDVSALVRGNYVLKVGIEQVKFIKQ